MAGLASLFFSSVAYGQQQAMFTQYMFNGLAINPAYAGSQEALSLTALARKQWIGLQGAPNTQTFSVHSPIKKQKIALGATFFNDEIGVTQQTGINACYAYRIFMPHSTLSFGLQAGFTSYRSDLTRVRVQDPNDPNFGTDDVNKFMPNFGTGIYYFTDRFYVGFSIPMLMNNYYNRQVGNDGSNALQVRHYFLSGGYVMDLSRSLKLKPNVMVKAVNGAPLAIDLNANLLIKEVLWVGASYRTFSSVNALLELQLTDQFRLGYSYDFATTNRQNGLNYGSHELMLNYRFAFLKTKTVTPRYF